MIWQKITEDSPPKNTGKPILVVREGWGPAICERAPNEGFEWDEWLDGGYYGLCVEFEPTHWAEIPNLGENGVFIEPKESSNE